MKSRRCATVPLEEYEQEVSATLGWQLYPAGTAKAPNFQLYLSKEIGDAEQYDELCHYLRSMPASATVDMYLNNGGGDMMAGTAILQAMRDSKAHITTILNPSAFSMAAILFLAGDSYRVPSNGLLMFHDYSGGGMSGGKGNEQIAEVQASQAWYENLLIDVCTPFLSLEDIAAVMKGKDIWLHAPEIEMRLLTTKSSLTPEPGSNPGLKKQRRATKG